MTKFNPFRVSFDGPLASGEHRRARIGAVAVCGLALVVGGASFVTLMNASSGKIAAWSNARLLADETASKPCSEQTWPYIQARCQTPPDPKSTARTTPKQEVALQSAPAANAKSRAAPAPQPSTTGAAPSAETIEPVAADQVASPQLARREQRQREEWIRLQRERREEARRVRQQRMEARNGGRQVARDERTARRGTDELSFGGNQRVVIRRGAFDDGFFGIFR